MENFELKALMDSLTNSVYSMALTNALHKNVTQIISKLNIDLLPEFQENMKIDFMAYLIDLVENLRVEQSAKDIFLKNGRDMYDTFL
jgi:hypothetical protein